MIPQPILITQPAVNFAQLASLTHQALGYSVTQSTDGYHRKLSDAEKFISSLDALRDPDAPVGLPPELLAHVDFAVLIAAIDRDMQDILSICSGMPFVVNDTTARGIQIAVIKGNLQQWRDAVAGGCSDRTQPMVRAGFNNIHRMFIEADLGSVWCDFTTTRRPDNTYLLLEDKR